MKIQNAKNTLPIPDEDCVQTYEDPHAALDKLNNKLDEVRRKLADAENKMEIALHVSDLGRWSLDLRNGLVSWDDRTRSFFDFPEQEVVHYKQVLHYIEREDLKRVLRAVKMGIYSDVNRLCDIRYRTSVDVAGDVRWLHMVGKVYLDNGGQPSFFSGVVQNITQTVVQQKKMDAYHAEIARKKRKLQLIVGCA
ncbi:PAS domain-containing protein [Sphingobacterium thalpophilum]|uniref:PAS domain-containing protein n=1 Tax=Sphingobacterium thalpophilum TaxID=259 RepID=UPI0024A685AD|nr:PAS domain-containing protein [Sphingobacterium thalpophilum]